MAAIQKTAGSDTEDIECEDAHAASLIKRRVQGDCECAASLLRAELHIVDARAIIRHGGVRARVLVAEPHVESACTMAAHNPWGN